MENKSKEVLDAVKLHLQEQRQAYRNLPPDMQETRAFKYNNEQFGVLLHMIERLEALYSTSDYYKRSICAASNTVYKAD